MRERAVRINVRETLWVSFKFCFYPCFEFSSFSCIRFRYSSFFFRILYERRRGMFLIDLICISQCTYVHDGTKQKRFFSLRSLFGNISIHQILIKTHWARDVMQRTKEKKIQKHIQVHFFWLVHTHHKRIELCFQCVREFFLWFNLYVSTASSITYNINLRSVFR